MSRPDLATLASHDVRRHVPDHLWDAIETPHVDENLEHNKPVWLLWKTAVVKSNLRGEGTVYGPYLDSVCDTEESAAYHVGAIFETPNPRVNLHVHVERVPCNHRFGSSLDEELNKLGITPNYVYRRQGD